MAALRGDLSQDELAAKMKERGYRWSQSTVWSVERGDRPLRLTEATDVLQCLGIPIEDLSRLLAWNDTDNQALERIRALSSDVRSIEFVCVDVFQYRRLLEWYIDDSLRGELPDGMQWVLPSDDVREKVKKILGETDTSVLLERFRDALESGYVSELDGSTAHLPTRGEIEEYFSRLGKESAAREYKRVQSPTPHNGRKHAK